jgi:hypothetical protein
VKKTLVVCALGLATSFALAGCSKEGGGGGVFASPVVGRYELDIDAVVAQAKEKAGAESMPPEMVEGMLKNAKMDFEVKSDHTYVGSFTMDFMGQKKESTTKGTWKQDGNQVSFTETENDGKPSEKKETKVATYADGRLTLADDGITLVLRKK